MDDARPPADPDPAVEATQPPSDDGLPAIAVVPVARPAIKPLEPPPPFGIGHLMLWTAGCCICFAVVRATAPQKPGVLGFAFLMAMALVYGGAWMGLAVVVSRWWRGDRWPREPGHWLVGIWGIKQAAEVALMAAPATIRLQPEQLLGATTACLLVFPALAQRVPGKWRVFFGLTALLVAGPPFYRAYLKLSMVDGDPTGILSCLQILRDLGTSVALVAVVALDWRAGIRRDWLHRLGLEFTLWHTLAPLLLRWMG